MEQSSGRGILRDGDVEPSIAIIVRIRGAALIANHGLVAVGPRPDKVLHITALVERTAQIVWGARALGGPVPIPDEVNRNFAGVYDYLRANA